MDVDRRHKSRAEFFFERFGPKFLFSIQFHMVMVTVSENVFGRCRPKTAMTIRMAYKVPTKYGGASIFKTNETNLGRTVGSDNKDVLFSHYKPHHMDVSGKPIVQPEILAIDRLLYGNAQVRLTNS